MVITITPNKLQDINKFGSIYQYTPKLINSGPRMWKNEYCSFVLPSVGSTPCLAGLLECVEFFFFFFGFLTTASHFPSTLS